MAALPESRFYTVSSIFRLVIKMFGWLVLLNDISSCLKCPKFSAAFGVKGKGGRGEARCTTFFPFLFLAPRLLSCLQSRSPSPSSPPPPLVKSLSARWHRYQRRRRTAAPTTAARTETLPAFYLPDSFSLSRTSNGRGSKRRGELRGLKGGGAGELVFPMV